MRRSYWTKIHPVLLGPNVARFLKAPAMTPATRLVHAYLKNDQFANDLATTQPSALSPAAFDEHHWNFLCKDVEEGTPIAIVEKKIGSPEKTWALGFFEPSLHSIPLFFWAEKNRVQKGANVVLPCIDHHFWLNRIRNAHDRRQIAGVEYPQNTVYRLLHGANDGIPGLFVDVFGRIVHVTVRGRGALYTLYALRQFLLEILGEPIFNIQGANESGWSQVPKECLECPAVENGVVHDIHRYVDVVPCTEKFDSSNCRLDGRLRGMRAALQYECANRHVLIVFPGAGYTFNVAAHAQAASILLLENRETALNLLRPKMLPIVPHPTLSEASPYLSIKDVDIAMFQVIVFHIPSEFFTVHDTVEDQCDYLQHVLRRAKRNGSVFLTFDPEYYTAVQRSMHLASKRISKKLYITRFFYPGPDYPVDLKAATQPPSPVGLQILVTY